MILPINKSCTSINTKNTVNGRILGILKKGNLHRRFPFDFTSNVLLSESYDHALPLFEE